MKRLALTIGLSLTLAAAVLPFSAAAARPTTAPATAPTASIPGLVTSNTLTYGTNFPYPPMEYYTGANADIPTGADVDLGTEIAHRLHLKPYFYDVTDFNVIVSGLQSHRWDVILSSLNETPARAKVVNFVPYANVGESILVRRGNPAHITTIADLSGKSVGVQANTTEAASLAQENKVLAAHHKPLINVSVFPQDSTAVQGLATNRFVAILEDYPVAAYNATQRPTLFQVAGHQFNASPYAMAFRKSDTVLRRDVKDALMSMRKDGTYIKILKKYGLGQAALK